MFVDRQTELQELRALADWPGPAMALIYGRRRVGKTYLLDHAWPDHRLFYFLAADASAALNRRELLTDLAAKFDLPMDPADYPTWRSVFRLLAEVAGHAPLVVVLDEFQYLTGQDDDDVASQLIAVWDREVGERDLTLVLCGSEVGTMERLQAGDSPLYGRINWAARIVPFDYRDAARMVPGRAPREWAYIYGVFGGTPRFLSVIESNDDFEERVKRTVLSPRGEVHLQLSTIIQQEQGIRNPSDYMTVLKAVAEGRRETQEIADVAGLGDRPYVARRALETLESLGIIRRERNFRAHARAAYRNVIADPAVSFWYRFVHRHRSRLEQGAIDEVWRSHVAPYLDDYMGQSVFEPMVEQAFRRHHAAWDLPAAREWSRWEGQDRNRRSIEIDVVAELDDGRILSGQVKWSSKPVDVGLHWRLLRDLDDLARSGEGWAAEALDEEKSAGHIYVSAAGFTPRFRTLADEIGSIRLVSLEDLYID